MLTDPTFQNTTVDLGFYPLKMNAKLKRILVIALSLGALMINSAKSQEYKIQSLEGNNVRFKVSKNEKNTLFIAYLADTVYIRDVKDIQSARVLGGRFLLIDYGIRSGTGINSRKTLLLSAGHNKINTCLNITSLFHEEFLDFDSHVTSPMKAEVKSIYHAKLSLLGNRMVNYKLVVKIRDERSSAHEPKTNYKKNLIETLNFDQERQIFYSTLEDISAYFTIWNAKSQKEIKQYVNGRFAVAKLGNYKYYDINGVWYEKIIAD